jgi:hypothetical protein
MSYSLDADHPEANPIHTYLSPTTAWDHRGGTTAGAISLKVHHFLLYPIICDYWSREYSRQFYTAGTEFHLHT